MTNVAFVFTQAPHGSSAGREGLDALLATCALTEHVSLFFISDGVFQLLPQQQPERVLARNYIASFRMLSLYDVNRCYVCEQSLQRRGLSMTNDWVLDAEIMTPDLFRSQLAACDVVLRF